MADIDIDFHKRVSVVIGPNAVGKSTVLEAIRLAKALLSPRTQNETNQALISNGAISPHLAQRLFPKALTNNPDIPLTVKCTFKPEQEELDYLYSVVPQISALIAQSGFGLSFANAAQAVSFFSSHQGQEAIKTASVEVMNALTEVKTNQEIEINLEINFKEASTRGEKPVHQAFYSALETRLDPYKTLFSYFPADRALPAGEQPVQLGLADTSTQLESYNSQPQQKYLRLKNSIFNSVITSSETRTNQEEMFKAIFAKVLRGRELGQIGINEIGMLSIPIIDTDRGIAFDVDGLSSGEKGLILIFLNIARSLADHGLVLLDEPELHLNPAVTRDLLNFFVEEFSVKKDIQFVFCSHSAELLAGALDNEECALYHLANSKSLVEVTLSDQGEIRDALRRLGSSESEALLYKGTIFVEGIHDVEVLQAGFDDTLRKYRVKARGGRSQIEKDIQELLTAEKNGVDVGYQFFLFDRDQNVTALKSGKYVKVLQLNKYCIENFLLDHEVIAHLSKDADFSKSPFRSKSEARKVIKDIALSQLPQHASYEAFKMFQLESIGFDMKGVTDGTESEMAHSLSAQIREMGSRLCTLAGNNFEQKFCDELSKKKRELEPLWDRKWQELCNGKRVFEDLRKQNFIFGDLLKTKRKIVREMQLKKTGSWTDLKRQIESLIKV